MRSDYGTNFIGAYAPLWNVFRVASAKARNIVDKVVQEGDELRFNPPQHFGDIWEAAAMFLDKVEACFNYRPLQVIADDPEDLEALTPGHSFIGALLKALSEPLSSNVPTNRLNRWRLFQQMRDYLWSHEYLQGLQLRAKW
ncbi:uncharacterized protein [Temnothorax longispinosus]|uniref:uncharacterized protein n=1 Tax=Temnothorax longispinosus TaxID=300112 RepID=UPI003A99EAC7